MCEIYEDNLCKLKKSLYRQKLSPWTWLEVQHNDLQSSTCDHSVFVNSFNLGAYDIVITDTNVSPACCSKYLASLDDFISCSLNHTLFFFFSISCLFIQALFAQNVHASLTDPSMQEFCVDFLLFSFLLSTLTYIRSWLKYIFGPYNITFQFLFLLNFQHSLPLVRSGTKFTHF